LNDLVVFVSPLYYRPTDVDILRDNRAKTKALPGCEAKTKFEELVKIMMKADMVKVMRKVIEISYLIFVKRREH
jgi:GDPmannose 4,6-dehydratase